MLDRINTFLIEFFFGFKTCFSLCYIAVANYFHPVFECVGYADTPVIVNSHRPHQEQGIHKQDLLIDKLHVSLQGHPSTILQDYHGLCLLQGQGEPDTLTMYGQTTVL